MATTSATLGHIASKTLAAGRVHAAKALLGEETSPEAAGATVEDLLSGSKPTSASNTPTKRASVKRKASATKKTAIKNSSTKKSRAS